MPHTMAGVRYKLLVAMPASQVLYKLRECIDYFVVQFCRVYLH